MSELNRKVVSDGKISTDGVRDTALLCANKKVGHIVAKAGKRMMMLIQSRTNEVVMVGNFKVKSPLWGSYFVDVW